MKYSININQLVFSENKTLDITHAAILDYLIVMDASRNTDIEKCRINGFTWINYKKLMVDMPLLRFKSKGSISPRIKALEECGFIVTETHMQNGLPRLYFKCTSRICALSILEKDKYSTVHVAERTVHVAERAVHVDEPISILDNNNIYNNLMSEIKISDVALDMQIYFNCAEAFRKLFIKIAQREGLPTKIYDKAKYKDYVTPIRLAVEADGYTIEQIRQAYNYLNSSFDVFWYKNIRSAKKLRQQLDKLVLEFNKVNKTA